MPRAPAGPEHVQPCIPHSSRLARLICDAVNSSPIAALIFALVPWKLLVSVIIFVTLVSCCVSRFVKAIIFSVNNNSKGRFDRNVMYFAKRKHDRAYIDMLELHA